MPSERIIDATISTISLTAMIDLSAALFVDVEASGFGADGGYPIEIGWANLSGDASSVLIRPMDHWTYWSEAAEKLHGIARHQLIDRGTPAREAAAAIAATLAGKTVFSDNPAHDRWWVAKLFGDVRQPRPSELDEIQNTKQLIASLFERKHLSYIDEMEIELEVKRLAPFRHRAAEDAAHWATFVRLVSERGSDLGVTR